jgi:protein-disulfide isomerase-like protein with CxxC motif
MTVLADATGPEQIRAGFTDAATATGEHAAQLSGLATGLAEAADWYTTLNMAGTTVEQLRQATGCLSAARRDLSTTGEHLQAALDDFNARDGRVGDAVTATGNLMDPGEAIPLGTGSSTGPLAASTQAGRHRSAGPDEEERVASPDQPTAPAAVKDPVKVGGKLVLRDGETFAGSAATKSDDEGNMVLAAAVDTPTGRTLHVGVPIYEEDKSRWKGAHAPAKDTEVDEEDDHTFTVNTGADRTVVLDAGTAAQLPAQVEDAIARASAADKEYRRLARRSDQLYNQRAQLESQRFDDPADAEAQMRLDSREHQNHTLQPRRRAEVGACADRLSPADRARYEQIQARIDKAGTDTFEPGKEQLAADLCGLPLKDFNELVELRKKPYMEQTMAERQRYEQISPARLPTLLAEQAAIVYGLTVEQYRELEKLEQLGPVRPPHLRRYGGRTAQQQQRYEQLSTAPGGVTGATPSQTKSLRGQFETYQGAHHAGKLDGAAARRHRADLQARAKPLPEPQAEQLRQVIAEHDELSARLDDLGGETTARVQVPARDGAALIVEAEQREEEGGVNYFVTTSRPSGDDDKADPEPYRTTGAGLRKLATMIADLAKPSN